ncbi:Endonuclease III [Candida viswanathii]|uniref:Endonuclease III homolog n=1 Tax=Candida viswanathii TaxID=5486 RepID=A0A367Y5Y7_9ASCO|nr:Endonuclease III [Candida viswanathii]
MVMKRSGTCVESTVAKKIKTESKEQRDSPHIKVEVENGTTALETPPNIFMKVDPSDAMTGPKGWTQLYNGVVAMRSKFLGPVDSQGCERMPNTINPNIKTRNPRIYRFQLLISLMLSSQTKDEVNYEAMKKLHQGLLLTHPDGLCIESLLKLSENEIDAYINKVGFHNRKSQYIKKTCDILLSQHGGDVPKTIAELTALPGLGPKMGYLFLQNGWGINDGIGVDVHLHRLAQMWGWVSKRANTPEKARLELEEWLPREYWGQINPLLVGFGQVVCVPRAPNCDICTLGRNGLCKSANKKMLEEGPISEERKIKLMKQRADLTKLINEVI